MFFDIEHMKEVNGDVEHIIVDSKKYFALSVFN